MDRNTPYRGIDLYSDLLIIETGDYLEITRFDSKEGGRNDHYARRAMSDESFMMARTPLETVGNAARRDVTILAIGEPDEWRRSGGIIPSEDVIAFCQFSEVNDELLRRLSPTLILSPVLARRFDCIDLATRLYQLSYPEKYRAIASNMPNPHIIEREIKSLCPTLNFAVIQAI